jgi:hypothetical protein
MRSLWSECNKLLNRILARNTSPLLCKGSRIVDCEVHCPMCEKTTEDDLHIFFECNTIQVCWQVAGLLSVVDNNTYQQGLAADRVFMMCRNEDRATMGKIATLF